MIGLFEVILGILSVSDHGVMIYQYQNMGIDMSMEDGELKNVRFLH